MYPEFVFMVLSVLANNSLIVHKPDQTIEDAYMCVTFSNNGNIKSECNWLNPWTLMTPKTINQNRNDVFVGDLDHLKKDDSALIYYKIKYLFRNQSYSSDSGWNSQIWNLDSYKKAYDDNGAILKYGGVIIFLISSVLIQITSGCLYIAYIRYKKFRDS